MKRGWLVKLWVIAVMSTLASPAKGVQPELVYKAEATTGEGAIWHPGRKSLFWVDIEGKTLYEFLPEKKNCRQWTFDRMATTVVPETENTVIVALQNEIIRLNLTDNVRTSVAKIDDAGGKYRFNDGKCDPEGRLWVGTMVLDGQAGATAALYTIDSQGRVTERLAGVTTSNGIVWTADKQYMYYNDTPTGRVARYRYDAATGNVTYDGIAVVMEPGTGGPDGMTIDRDGNLWVAQWGGYGVYCYNPLTGKLINKVETPAPNVASCAFGGENMDILYITTARAGLSEEKLKAYPLSGSLFSCKPGAAGVKAFYFGK
ncbi:MAG: Gluconolactonase [Bacteroidales bacterium]